MQYINIANQLETMIGFPPMVTQDHFLVQRGGFVQRYTNNVFIIIGCAAQYVD